jgi:GAF domain-containing protein
VDFASITILGKDRTLRTIGATDPRAETLDALQYELHEGPCYAAVTDERFVLVNDLAADGRFPRYAPKAAELGAGSQLAFQLVHNGDRAGLNLYAHTPGAFDESTVQLAELFGTHAAVVLSFAKQVEHLSEALHVRTDVGTAVGVVMERYDISREQAFAFLVRNSNDRNVKVRALALDIINRTFQSTLDEDSRSQKWP